MRNVNDIACERKVQLLFSGLTFTLTAGEILQIAGPNGAGKTTLMDVITGKTRPQSGKALYDQSVDLTTLDPVAIARQGIGRKFQKPTVFEALTVAENLELAMKGDKSVWASLRARLNSEQADRISETLRLLRLEGERYRPAGLLSHGQKQFLEIGMLLMQVFSVELGWLPTVGADSWRHYILPSLTLGAAVAAVMARFTRASFVDVLHEDYMRTARAKGVSETLVVLKHGLRNAMIPVVTMMGLQFGFLLGGSIVVE